jgi:crossover junction endodeoxyribonuclease RuvC
LIVLGIDPGTIVTGYGLVKSRLHTGQELLDYGCIRPPAKAKISKRYHIIFDAVEELIRKHKPDALSVETQYVDKNVQSAMKLGMARGVIILAATRNEVPVFEYAPSKAKKAVVGTGRASKEQVQGMIQLLLNLSSPPEPHDAADALAMAICHLQTTQYQMNLGIQL